jgi:ribosomal protein L20A (L18A)
MAPRKTLAKKTKTIISVSEEDMSSKSKGGQSPIPISLWEVSTVTEEDIKNLVVREFLAPRELLGY